MKKQKIQFIVLILILAALAGAFFGIRKYKEAQAQKPAEEEGTAVFDVDSGDVVNIIYDYDGETYQYEKVEDIWYLAEDHSQTVKQYYLSAMATGVSSLEAAQILENVTDLSQYGLDAPRTVIFDTAIQRFRIYVGDRNSMTSSYYIQLPDKPDTVYVVPETYINSFNYGLNDIIEVQEDETGTDMDADAGAGTETDMDVDVGTGTGTDMDADAGAGTETDMGTEVNTGTGADKEGSTGTK